MTLRTCPPGLDLVVRRLAGSRGDRRKLLAWGFVPGARIRTVARGPAGGLVVAVRDARIALDAATAGCLLVESAS